MPKPGDAVVVCRADGSSSFYLLDVDHEDLFGRLAAGEDLTETEAGQLIAAQKAMLLYLASLNEKVMETLEAMANAPGSYGDAATGALN
ncbi:hypothetical protein [Defluviimonas sp. WL0075]|uniref:Uncharacterized protein n=1 Tax=Albidovulum sediminicola TaxID=2984331 RepID=A0ABT2Z762_9RHOB|nr:hypothetical protein [Defluviimonas sp. WL0075]MCV2866900.1 hypothetical protein [Defluviimonas sp. WL0075]